MLLKLVSSFIPFPTLSYSLFTKTESKPNDDDDNDDQHPENIHFKKAITAMSNESETSLKNFITALEKCISTVSKRYRENILQQIAVLSQNDSALLNAEEFIKLQQERTKLEGHLRDYKLLAENSGRMAFNQAVSLLHCGVSDPGRIVCQVYCTFEKMYTNEYNMNDEYERNLTWMEEVLRRRMQRIGDDNWNNQQQNEGFNN